MNTEIQCPNCQNVIVIETSMLLEGKSFSCSNPECDAAVALSSDSVETASASFSEFEKLKQQSLK